jgi:hypothetical protein
MCRGSLIKPDIAGLQSCTVLSANMCAKLGRLYGEYLGKIRSDLPICDCFHDGESLGE